MRVQLAAVVDPALARLLVERRVRALDELLHVDLLGVQREAARIELRQVEDVADEPREPFRLGGDDVQREVARVGVLDQPLAERGDVASNRRQRRAQLVRHRHEEVPLELLGLAEPSRHVPEALRQVADLASTRHRGHLDGVVAAATSSATRERSSTGRVSRRER